MLGCRYRLLFIIVLLVAPLITEGADPLPLRHITKREGLSQNSVIAITQDGKGFLWFGTRDGLNRFDGNSFKVYRQQQAAEGSLVFNDIHALYYDEAADWLWVGTTQGLSRYRQQTDDFISYVGDSPLANAFVHFIFRDREGLLWAGTDGGLFLYAPESDDFLPVPALPGRVCRVMTEDATGQRLVGTPQGVYRISGNPAAMDIRFQPVFTEKQAQVKPFVQDILPDSRGGIWIATRFTGIYRMQPGEDEIRHYSTGGKPGATLSDNNVRSLTWGADSSLWAGTLVGLNQLPPGSDSFTFFLTAPEEPTAIPNHSIHDIFVDKRGSLWIGSYYGGVAFHDERLASVRHYSRGKGTLNHSVVSAFAEGPDGRLWIGTEGGGLNVLDRATGKFSQLDESDGLVGNNIKSLLFQDEHLWIGTYQAGFCRLNTSTGLVETAAELLPSALSQQIKNVYGLLLQGEDLWLAFYGAGLGRFNTRTGEMTLYQHRESNDNSLLSNQCRSLVADRRGRIWVGTSSGLCRLTLTDDKEGVAFRHFLRGQIIYSLETDKEGDVWVGTYGRGLYRIDIQADRASAYEDDEESFGESTVYSIVRDMDSNLWVSTSRGLFSQDTQRKRLHNFDTPFNFTEQEFGINAAIRTGNGELAFGGTEGFTLFQPGNLPVENASSPLVFTELRVANQPVAIGAPNGILQAAIDEAEELVFPYNKAIFSLSFASLDYLSPHDHRYAYKLEGVDENWVSSRGTATANYTLQNAGTYLFRVRSYDGDGSSRPVERTLRIKVLPPWWFSGYALLSYALIGLLVILGIFRYTYLQHLLKLEQAEKDQQEALHQAKLRFFTNITHELRTPLTMILGPLESIRNNQEVSQPVAERLLTVEKNSRRLLSLVNQLLSFRKLAGERESLQLDGQDLVTFCQDTLRSFVEHAKERELSLHFLTEEERLPLRFDADKLEKVLYNLLANACKFTPAGGRVEVALRREGTKVHLRVTDNGEGIPHEVQDHIFARFFERKSLTSREGTGIGLAIVREYVEMHGGEISVNSSPGIGSSFTFWIPLRPVISVTDPAPETPPAGLPDPSSFLAEQEGPDSPTPSLILVVEDNVEVRDYVESVLVADYRVDTAANGKEGLAKAFRISPDLIISDVMMPEMDGLTFCNALKNDLRTSHVPLILLTAASSDLQKLSGLEIGADDYLTKPFSPRELQLRIRNILLSVARARSRAGQTLQLEPGEVQVTPADTKFLQKAIQLIDQQMQNTGYKVDDFARDLTVSRALLFTKMKAITGHTPNGFIKMLRMKRAAQLLKTKELTVAEVAGRVGYRDVKYFSKSFRRAYGCPPSEYGQEQAV